MPVRQTGRRRNESILQSRTRTPVTKRVRRTPVRTRRNRSPFRFQIQRRLTILAREHKLKTKTEKRTNRKTTAEKSQCDTLQASAVQRSFHTMNDLSEGIY